MIRRIFPLLFILLTLIIVTVACGAGAAPTYAPVETSEAALPTPASAATQPSETTAAPTSQPLPTSGVPTTLPRQPAAIPEQRMLTLEWPSRMRAGDSGMIRLTLEMDDKGHITQTAEVEGQTTKGEVVEIPNLYATHSVYAEARLDLAGVDVAPNDLVSQTLLPGRSVTFKWSIRVPEASVYKGTVWFYLRYIPKAGGEAVQTAISAQPVEIRAGNLLGLSGQPARWVGALGSVIGSLLGVDTFIETGWKFLKRRKLVPTKAPKM